MNDTLVKKFEISEIISMFKTEFGCISDKFSDVIDLTLDEALKKNDALAKPGVYVFWKDKQVWKVGRHLENSRKRAVEHVNVPAEQDYPMTKLSEEPGNVHVLLFNVKEHDLKAGKDFRHWVAALEVYFELHLSPYVKSKRLG